MHLVESFSLCSGLEILSPSIERSYFPLNFDKYIVIHAGGGKDGNFPSKIYDYFQDVVDLLEPVLKERGIKIVQIGGKDEKALHGCVDLCGQTSFNQSAYIVSNALCFIGNDSFNAHLASCFDVKSVVLFGPTTPENHGPYKQFSSSYKTILLIGDRKGNQPSFSNVENPKTINTIKPEEVAISCLDLLELDPLQINQKTVYIGSHYNESILEFVPDALLNPSLFQGQDITCRLDYHFDEDTFFKNLASRPLNVVTNKKINLQKLSKANLKNIVALNIEANNEITPFYVKDLLKLGIKVNLYSYLPDGQELNDLRFKFFDIAYVCQIIDKKREDLPKEVLDVISKCRYKTRKYLLGRNKIYSGHSSYLNDKPLNSFSDDTQKIIDEEEFFVDQDFHYYYIKKERKPRSFSSGVNFVNL